MASIGIVGAGIIGTAAALWLRADGHAVTVFEADPDGLPASTGNAALLAFPEIDPIASPGIVTTVPRWLLDPLGPLALRWRDVPALTPWLLRFLASATPARAESARTALANLMQSARADHEDLARRAGKSGYIRHTGLVSVFDTIGGRDAALSDARHAAGLLGHAVEPLDVAAARALVPQLEGDFAGAIHFPGYHMVSDPRELLRGLQGELAAAQALRTARVARLVAGETQATLETADGGRAAFDAIIVAGGVWSRDLVRPLGLRVPLETERGYNTTFYDLGWNLPMPLGFSDHGFMASPLATGLRVGGAVELARPDAPPNFARARAMRTRMRRYVPALPEAGGVEWMGRRPSMPDSVPVIGAHPRNPRILLAFGHGHLGLTLSAVTARLLAALVASADPGLDMAPYSIARFQSRTPS